MMAEEGNCSRMSNSSDDATLRLFQTVAYTPVFVAGLLLNTSALWLFFRLRTWTDTHIYMFNLILADLLVILFLPFRIYDTVYSMQSGGFCAFLVMVHQTNMYVSMLTVAAISAHRFVAVSFPLLTKTLETRRKMIAHVVCALVWITVMAIYVGLLGPRPEKLRTCYDVKLQKPRLSRLLVVQIVGYLLPMATVVTCSTGAMCTVAKSAEDCHERAEEKNAAGRKKAVAIIKANMIVFIVCFTPLHVAYWLRFYCWNTDHFSYVFYKVAQWIATTNCCLDSVGYYFLFKKGFQRQEFA
ncbi:G-protein coupled receptor 35 isoform X2 [Electrophorus electricus]|uniref:G-protein coupled receptor 35 isoform X2 n=1 Tax=Electrophorus electricus TaxID=8005 RepID=UPI0015D07E56|nr:G-protein coupled receptor 35 isoform X2 [Electrophorus electricus]